MNKSAITILNKSSDFNKNSKQIEEEKFNVTVIEYPTSPQTLGLVADNSFILNGVLSKVIGGVNTPLISENITDLEKWEKIKNTMVNFGLKNIYVNGNAWFEVIKTKDGKILEIIPIVTDTIRLLPGGEGAVQKIGADEVYFNIFESDENAKKEKEQIYIQTKAGKNGLVAESIEGKLRTGYNPNLNDVILIKETNIDSRYYGKAKIINSMSQILLLKSIDDYFTSFFLKGTMKAKIMYDKTGKMTAKDKQLLQELFKQKAQGDKNAFSSLVISGDVGFIDVDSDIDAKQFNEMRGELRQDILVSLEMPYDMLYTNNSNQATAIVSKENFYDYTIFPYQELFAKYLNMFISSENNGKVTFTKTNVKDSIAETKLIIESKKEGIISANEARQIGPYELENKEGGDDLNISEKEITKEEKEKLIKSFNEFAL